MSGKLYPVIFYIIRKEKSTGGEKLAIVADNAPIPENLSRIIKERGLKQSAVAERAGYSKQQFTDMLNGRKIIKSCDAMAIANALGVDVGELFAECRSTA